MGSEHVTFGGWCHLESPFAVELMASLGFDWCCLDMQHGTIRTDDVVGLLQAVQAAGATAYVRVPGPGAPLIGAVLDAGAAGVIVPQVSTPEQARAAAAACRYSPDGSRSWGPLRPSWGRHVLIPQSWAPLPATSWSRTAPAVGNTAAIAAVPGLTGIIAGPADLALDLWGDPYLASDPRTVEKLAPVVAACRENGITAGVFCGTGNVAPVAHRGVHHARRRVGLDAAAHRRPPRGRGRARAARRRLTRGGRHGDHVPHLRARCRPAHRGPRRRRDPRHLSGAAGVRAGERAAKPVGDVGDRRRLCDRARCRGRADDAPGDADPDNRRDRAGDVVRRAARPRAAAPQQDPRSHPRPGARTAGA
ncbi:MAG: hypothetical protein EKK42_22175 [Pseudonocardiaceae bacterium]|nr:MAG: hypothetical protein EKK42_22175 [Pseudonocardiaceae bacterium]